MNRYQKHRGSPYKDDHDIDREYPDPPFTQKDYDEIRAEVVEIEKTQTEEEKKARPYISVRERWIVKHGGGRFQGREFLVRRAYPKVADKWDKFVEWAAKKDYAEGRKMEQFAKMEGESVEKI
jgi:hypothetical protein